MAGTARSRLGDSDSRAALVTLQASNTRVGVVVPNKNGARFLGAALESIYSQEHRCIECIVADSLSVDDSAAVFEAFAGRARWFSEKDTCAAQAINRGWSRMTAPVLTWLNSDDLWAPGAATRVMEVFDRHPDVDVVSGECGVIDEDGGLIGEWRSGPFDIERSLSRADHILNQPAVFIRRSALERVGWLRETWLHDHDLWLRLALSGARFLHADDVLAFARERPSNLGADADLVAPLRVKIIEDFFARDDVPPELRRIRGRALSWANARGAGMYFRHPRGYGKALRYLGRAFRHDPSNVDVLRAAGRRLRDKVPSIRRRTAT